MKSASDQRGQRRIVPTRPGWWYAQWAHDEPSDDMIFIASVLQDEHRLFVHLGGVTSDLRAFRWLAPIPGHATCAALARYSEAVDDLDALWDGADFITRNNVTNRADDASMALDAAIRAERDGAA